MYVTCDQLLPVIYDPRLSSKHRQGWFTYAYCHNSHVRQFRELLNPRPLAPGNACQSQRKIIIFFLHAGPQEKLMKSRRILT